MGLGAAVQDVGPPDSGAKCGDPSPLELVMEPTPWSGAGAF